jgi:FMN-dependent NADH-azoreductase
MKNKLIVRVYFNLHKRRFSVLTKQEKGWRLAQHTDHITLHDITFKVSEAGRQRVLREKRENVHAYVQGTVGFMGGSEAVEMSAVNYNPYKASTFMKDGSPIHTARSAVLTVGSTQIPAMYAA